MSLVLNNLTLTMERKTEKIKFLKKRLDFVSPIFKVSGLISALLIIYIVFVKQDILTNYISSLFSSNSSSLSSTDLLIIQICIYSIIITTFIWVFYSRIFKKYENLRKDIIDSIDNEFCRHPQGCKCKDEYILEMDEYDIDVVFK